MGSSTVTVVLDGLRERQRRTMRISFTNNIDDFDDDRHDDLGLVVVNRKP